MQVTARGMAPAQLTDLRARVGLLGAALTRCAPTPRQSRAGVPRRAAGFRTLGEGGGYADGGAQHPTGCAGGEYVAIVDEPRVVKARL